MSSILTNVSAMVALQTLKTINMGLDKTQQEISTGKKIASAKDNAAMWAISKVMESDVKGFKAISESLALGESTVAVARNATETVTELLTDIKAKVIAAQEENVDRTKIQTDVDALRDQIASVVNAAQFNGLNLVKGTEDVNILSSLDRDGSGSVSASNITIQRQDLTTDAGVNGVGLGGTDLSGQILDSTGATYAGATLSSTGNVATLQFDSTGNNNWDTGDIATVTVAGQTVSYTVAADATTDATVAGALLTSLQALDLESISFAAGGAADQIAITSTRAFEDVDIAVDETSTTGDGNVYVLDINGAATGNTTTETGTIDQRAEEVFFTTAATPTEGNSYQASVGGTAYFYTAGKGENMEDVARGLKTAIDSAGLTDITTEVAIDSTSGQVSLKIDNSGTDVSLATAAADGGEASGGLFGLDAIDITSNEGANSALDTIETLIENSIDAAAEFGSAQGRIEIQGGFVSKLTDSLVSSISTIVDANMEEASARLQALQVQQQLGIQSLSIANQQPQNLLSLFR